MKTTSTNQATFKRVIVRGTKKSATKPRVVRRRKGTKRK